MSPLYAVILFRFFSFTFLIHQYMLSFFKFCLFTSAFLFRHCISPFYFANLFSPSILFYHLFSPFHFISPFFFALYCIPPFFSALLFYFAHFFFALLFYFAILFRPSILFHHSFRPSILSFHLYFQMQTRFRISISGLHSNISSHTGMNTPHNNTTYFSRLMRIWNPATLHTFHDSYDSQRLTTHTTHDSRNLESNTACDSRLIRLTKPEIQYDSRLTTFVLISPVNFALLFSPFYFVSYLNCQIYTRFHLSISFVSKFFFIYKPFCFSLF